MVYMPRSGEATRQNILDTAQGLILQHGFAGASIERIEDIAAGKAPTPEEREFLERVSKFGDIFRYKLFDPSGRLQVVSDSFFQGNAEPSDLGQHNANAIAAEAKTTRQAVCPRQPRRNLEKAPSSVREPRG